MKISSNILFFFIILFSTITIHAQVTLVPVASGFVDPVDIKHAGDNRIFIVEQNGYIRIMDTAGNVNPQPFLDIHTQITPGGEQGFLGLAFSPDYNTDGRFFVNYIDLNGDSHIDRFTVSATNPDSADPSSQQPILFVSQPFSNHNGGDIRFGADGYLYCAFGDGGSGGDPGDRAQNLQELLGKILRINVNVPSGYSIPSDNPFFNDPNAYDEIWAYGLRNPWRNSFDRVTHDFWIGDVGQGLWEEISFQPASSPGGENYGWRCYEGNATYNTIGCGPVSNYIFPVFEFTHINGNCSVTGGNVYRGAKYGALFGKYFHSDYCSGRMTSLVPDTAGGWTAVNEGNFADSEHSSFGEDKFGELYVTGHTSGNIYKITSADCTPVAFISVEDTINFCGDSLVLSSPAGQGFFYAWYRNGIGIQASGNNSLIVTQSGNYYVTVLNPANCTAISDTVYVNLQNAPAVNFTGLPSFICINQGLITLTGIPSGGTFSGNGITGSVFDPVAAGAGSHNITYSYLAASGCTASKSHVIAVDACVSVPENFMFRNFQISPNPNNGMFDLDVTAAKNVNAEIEILNVFGQSCFKNLQAVQAGKSNVQFDLKNLAGGIYFLRLTSDEGTISTKFIISK